MKALGSSPSTTKKKRKKMKSRELYAMICLSSRTPENLGAKTQRSRGQGKREKH
jgi:hypothetical protein